MNRSKNARGAEWHRWDPHLHAPGTVLADNFGADAWDAYVAALEASDPPIRALGVTDYYGFDGYRELVRRKATGALSGVDLIFPNIEMRFGIGTGSNRPINFHLLVSPNDPNHIDRLTNFMRSLTFRAHEETWMCDRSGLVGLGRAHEKNPQLDERAALRSGANQFKVDFASLRKAFEASEWARKNILVAVASTEGDGTAGLQGDSSFATLRKEIEKFADVIFGSSQRMREFWLGQGAASPEQLRDGWGGPKPCLHGSDAHSLAGVGKPTNNLFTWVKGDVTFEALNQVVLEPSQRAFVGQEAPIGALPSEVISSLTVSGAPWFANGSIDLNAGLVAIIGARGSGKTALAELIAAGAYAARPHMEESERKSFLFRASKHLNEASAKLKWQSGPDTSNDLSLVGLEAVMDSPRVRYLSQQFVDALCSAEGVTDALLSEIKRVVFLAHQEEDRMGASDFDQLLDLRAERSRNERARQEASIERAAAQLNTERQSRDALPALRKQLEEAKAGLEKDKSDRRTLVEKAPKGSDGAAAKLEELAPFAAARRTQIQISQRRHQSLLALGDEARSMKEITFGKLLSELKTSHRDAGLDETAWQEFEVAFRGDPVRAIQAAIAQVEAATRKLRGGPPIMDATGKPTIEPLAPDANLAELPLNALTQEIERLTATVGVATEHSKAFVRLSEKITSTEAAVAKLVEQIAFAEGAGNRIDVLLAARAAHYEKAIAAIVAEEEELRSLYEPLRAQIEGQPGALGKLSFSVRRTVDAKSWSDAGELLIDTRKAGAFRGKGSLFAEVESKLLPFWRDGTAEDVGAAMLAFRAEHDQHFIEQTLEEKSNLQKYRAWAARLSAWLYSTDHIKIGYSIQYDGVDIEQLSPGTRGIVLLLLYLSIDRTDDRPLIIDQPEENLDPKSVYVELVERFRQTKIRRQIIIVTHNANLVVNTDADQVIVAQATGHQAGSLPSIAYVSGGLEDPIIRQHVCEILEGGEAAFLERARRLRISV